jgi:hypothetical protein
MSTQRAAPGCSSRLQRVRDPAATHDVHLPRHGAPSHWATWIGALPALMGWTAATGRTDLAGLTVFDQRDYNTAGLKTLPGTHRLFAVMTLDGQA